MSIRVYDFDYNLLGETDYPVSREWDLKFNGIGTFEASFELDSGFASVFAQNKNLVILDGDKQAVCVGYKIADRLRVFGRTPEWLFTKRVILPFKTSQIFQNQYTDPETIIHYLLESTYKTPHPISEDGVIDESVIDEDAVCDDLIIPEPGGMENLNRHFWRNSANTLSEVIVDLCDLGSCGHSLAFCPEEKCWKFSIRQGEEKNIIISKSLKNAYDMSLKQSLLDSAGGGYFPVTLQEESEEDAPQLYGYVEGENPGTGLLKWDKVFDSASGSSEVYSQLKLCGTDVQTECEVINASYGTDYCLGDILRVQVEIGEFRYSAKLRVSGVSIISGSSGNSVKPVFVEI